MNAPADRSNNGENGFTLVEVMVAAILTAIFFASLFELNAMCLRLLDSSKESLAGLQSVNDRIETLRNRSFYDLTQTACPSCTATPCPVPCVHDLLATAPNPGPIGQRFTEVVTISKYSLANPSPSSSQVTEFTRAPDGTVTTNSLTTENATCAGVDPTTCNGGSGPWEMAKVDLKVSWTTTVGNRARTEQTSCIVANGSKK